MRVDSLGLTLAEMRAGLKAVKMDERSVVSSVVRKDELLVEQLVA